MANYIDFPEEVSRYYSQTYRKENPYADVLSSLVRSYSGVNTQISAMNTGAQQLARSSSQRSIADIHSAFEQGRQGLARSGFSGAFSRGVGRTLESGQREAVSQATVESKMNLPQTEKLDMGEDPFYKAYIADTQSKIESTAGLAKNLFSYLNTDETLDDIEFAIAQGYMVKTNNNKVILTEKGKIMLNHYTSQIETKDDEITDELISNKGTFKRYVQEKMGDKYDETALMESLEVLSDMTGVKLGEVDEHDDEYFMKLLNKPSTKIVKGEKGIESNVIELEDGSKFTFQDLVNLGILEKGKEANQWIALLTLLTQVNVNK